MSRSCHSATSSSAACGSRAARGRARDALGRIGLRLWGIALEPFWPARNGSSTSRTSVRWRWRISVAKRSSPAPARAIAASSSACAVARDDLGRDRLAARPSRASTRCLVVGPQRRVGPDRAGDRAGPPPGRRRAPAARVAVRLEREAGELEPERVGSACTPWVRPTHSVPACSRARVGERGGQGARARHDDRAGAAQLQRERRVEHVGGGQPVVDPATGRRRRDAPSTSTNAATSWSVTRSRSLRRPRR